MLELDPPADGASLKNGSTTSTSTVKTVEDTDQDQAKETLYFIKYVIYLCSFVCLFVVCPFVCPSVLTLCAGHRYGQLTSGIHKYFRKLE